MTAPSSHLPSVARHGPPTGRLLVVDDEPAVRMVIGRGLARAGYDVFLADSGLDALHQLHQLHQHSRFDAVISDISMPTMTGTELAAEMHRTYPGVPILLSPAVWPPRTSSTIPSST